MRCCDLAIRYGMPERTWGLMCQKRCDPADADIVNEGCLRGMFLESCWHVDRFLIRSQLTGVVDLHRPYARCMLV
jgi:hypothetical protein